jgi:type II secretory ATPase GspE/PulE/Tfp pilus assembly ATPase PilB-like protein/GAF domain-containing protein
MSAVLKDADSASGEPAPGDKRMSLELLFFRNLQQVTNRIHATENVDQLMLEASGDICKLFNADRLTIYAIGDDKQSIVSKIKTGLNSNRELKLPLSTQSIAGYAALSKELVNIADVYDDEALKAIHPNLQFLKEVDKRSGYRTKQMLVAPILDDSKNLLGVMQIINNRSDQAFGKLEEDGARTIAKTLAIAIHQRQSRPTVAPSADDRKRATKYDGLIADAVLKADELDKAVTLARDQGVTVEHLLMSEYHLKPAQIGPSLARFFGVPYEPYSAGRIRVEALMKPLKKEFVEEQQWLPLEETPDGLVVMCVDPEAVRNSRVVQQIFPRYSKFVFRVTTHTEFEETLVQLVGAPDANINQLLDDLNSGALDDESGPTDDAAMSAASDNELVKFVNKVIVDAYNMKASDIHIEPLPGKAKTGIRFRIDGTLQPYIEIPANFRQAFVTRLKIMCDLDISEKRKPQDGKIKFKKWGPLDIELRVATIPSAGGVEDVVMRILAAGEPIPLDKLGLTPGNKKRLVPTIEKPYGLFYVCGPTGSGKTTTLHSILKHLNTAETKIWTAEDPVEITQRGLRQVQINKKAGIDFALVMRAFLRADPDIIMVGESRDKETVSMGVEASLTGHLVFSTLHTNSAPESITRLLDMGMDPFNFADALLGILAQRLAKRLCDCKEAFDPTAEEVKIFVAEYAEELRHTPEWKADYAGEAKKLYAQWVEDYGQDGKLKMYRAKGCEKCGNTGYKGRVGLHELLIADETVKKLVQERARVAEIFTAAVASGMRTLKMDGMEKILMGLTDLKQVRSVCIK